MNGRVQTSSLPLLSWRRWPFSSYFHVFPLSLAFRGGRILSGGARATRRIFTAGSDWFSLFLTDRCTTERTLHPVSLATTHVRRCWVGSLTVHQTACGWSSTATPPEPIRASASHTPVSCLTNKVFSKRGKSPLFSSVFTLSFEGFFPRLLPENKTKSFSLLPSLFFFLKCTEDGTVIP